jgi:hypothetical protein
MADCNERFSRHGKDKSPNSTLTSSYETIWPFVRFDRMMGMGDIILDRIAFGGVKELEEIYSDD